MMASLFRNNSNSNTVLENFFDYDWIGNIRELKNTINYAVALSSKDSIEMEDLPSNFTLNDQQEASENIREEIEKNLILKMLQKANHNKKKAAELLDMSRKTLYSRLEKYGISTSK